MNARRVTLFCFDYVDSGLGVYSRAYYPTRKSAERERRRMIRERCFNPVDPEEGCCGADHEIGDVYPETVSLTPRGVLEALRNSDPNGG